MILQKLILENFQGIRSLTLDFPKGCSGNIYGDNATGKTTVFNSITYLLFDKASTGAKNFNPKTRDKNGEVHNLDHSVTGEFILDNGEIVTLKKVFKETWKKRRGAAEKTLEGHAVEYSINGVPTKEKDYNSAIIGWLGDVEKAKILTMPNYFPETMKWEDRRQILLDVCGDISDEDVISSTPELADLNRILLIPGTTDTRYSIDDYRKITAAKRKDINARLDALPSRIDEAEKAIPDVSGENETDIREKINVLEKELESLQTAIADAMSGNNVVAELKAQIAQKRAEAAEAKAAFVSKENEKNTAVQERIKALESKELEIRRKIRDNENALDSGVDALKRLEKKRESLLEEWNETTAIKWNPDREICPTCGQMLPAEKIESMRAGFNLKRSQRLEELNKTGQSECSKEMIEAKKAQIENLKTAEKNLHAELDQIVSEISKEKSKWIVVEPFEETPEHHEYVQTITQLMEKMTDSDSASQEAVQGLNRQINDKRVEMFDLQSKLSNFAIVEVQRARIEELEEEQRELSAAFDETEHGLYLADLFLKTKVSMLTDRINSKFKTVSFQLFVEQVNGGLKESCEVLVPGEGGRLIPYAYANNAAKINAGLEIIDTLSNHWNIHTLVFLDNCESNTHPLKTGSQQIRLYVSEADKTLRLVTDK